MKKVLVIAPYRFLPYYSGGQKYIARFLHHLGNQAELTVISVAGNDTSLAGNYLIIPLLKKGFSRYYDFSLVRKITEEVKKGSYDTVIWEHPYFSWLAYRVRRRTAVKTIIHTHNIEYQRFRSVGKWWWPGLKWYEKKCLQKADKVFFITASDKNFAIMNWGLDPENCVEIPFGIEINEYPKDKADAQKIIKHRHQIPEEDKIILFNGLLNYKPNLDALLAILKEINPRLMRESEFHYKIIVCGKGLPESLDNLKEYFSSNIIYAGFVNDIETYFKGADIFLNPVLSGGGIKTKMVEAIAFGTTVVSTETGAEGIAKDVSGNKLIMAGDYDWGGFAMAVVSNTTIGQETSSGFYKFYSWGKIIQRIQ